MGVQKEIPPHYKWIVKRVSKVITADTVVESNCNNINILNQGTDDITISMDDGQAATFVPDAGFETNNDKDIFEATVYDVKFTGASRAVLVVRTFSYPR